MASRRVQNRRYTPATMLVRIDVPEPVNVRRPEIAGPLSEEGLTGAVLNTALGFVGEMSTIAGAPGATEGLASTRTLVLPPPTVARASTRTPQRGDAA